MTGFWNGRVVLITGAKGFVGANLARAILDRGGVAIGADLSGPSPSLATLFEKALPPYVAVADVTEPEAMRIVVGDVRPSVVFHLAGLGHIFDCQNRPAEAFTINAFGTVSVLEAVRRAAPEAIVVCASSNHVYLGGNPNAQVVGVPRRHGGGYGMTEACPLQATDAYGASKAAADLAVKCYRESYGLRAAALRHVNSYGPADPHESHLVTGAILACLRPERPKLRSDGSAIKAYLHVQDVVSAYLTVAEHIDDLPGHAVNVSDPTCEAPAFAIAHTVMEIARVPGGPELLRQDLSQQGYEERLDATLLRSLGWAPIHTLHTGIAATYAWYQEHGGMAWLK